MIIIKTWDQENRDEGSLSLYMTNAHQYYTCNDDDDDENENGTGEEQIQSAMMILGSKLTHSCIPNLGYSSLYTPPQQQPQQQGKESVIQTKKTKPMEPCVSYLILRPIRKGDVLTCSYLCDLFETSTPDRRRHLNETKTFWC